MAKQNLTFTDKGFGSGADTLSYKGIFYHPYEQPDLALGNAFLALGKTLDGAAERQDRIDASFFKTETQTLFASRVYGDGTEDNPGLVNTRKGLNAVGVSTSVDELTNWVKDNDKYKNMPDLLKADFDNWFTQYSTNERIKLAKFEQAQVVQGQLEQNAVVVDGIAQQLAITPLDDAAGYGVLKSQLDAAMADRGGIEGWTPEYTAMQANNAFSGLLVKNGMQASSAVEGINFLKSVSPWVTNTEMAEAMARLRPKADHELAAQRAAAVKAAKAQGESSGLSGQEAVDALNIVGSYETLLQQCGGDRARADAIVKEANKFIRQEETFERVKQKSLTAQVERGVTGIYGEKGYQPALWALSQAYASGDLDAKGYEKSLNFLDSIDTATSSAVANLSPKNQVARQEVLSGFNDGLLDSEKLDSAVQKHLITQSEYQKMRTDMENGVSTPVSSPEGKSHMQSIDKDIFKPAMKAAGDDPIAQQKVVASRVEYQNYLNSGVRNGTVDIGDTVKGGAAARSALGAAYEMRETPEFLVSVNAATVYVKNSVTWPEGISTEAVTAALRPFYADYYARYGGRQPTKEEINDYIQQQPLGWKVGEGTAASSEGQNRGARYGR